jgi:hypothetical protein
MERLPDFMTFRLLENIRARYSEVEFFVQYFVGRQLYLSGIAGKELVPQETS